MYFFCNVVILDIDVYSGIVPIIAMSGTDDGIPAKSKEILKFYRPDSVFYLFL